jgi:3,4-dihydroxy-2-butanone 4-phosphate synthase
MRWISCCVLTLGCRRNEEFDAVQVDFLRRQSAGTLCHVSHEEAGRRLGLPVQ